MVDDVVKQVAVMADDQNGGGIGLEIIDQPQHAFEIEIIGRLVKQQQVGLREQHGGERHAHAPAAGEFAQRPVLRRLVEAEAGQNARRPRRRGMRLDVGEPGLDFGDAMGIAGVLGLGEQRLALDVGLEHEIDQPLRAAGGLLLDAADAGLFGQAHRARLGGDFAADQPKQRGLAGAVAPDQPHPRPGRQGRRGLVDEQAFADAVAQVVEMQHGALLARHASGCKIPSPAGAGRISLSCLPRAGRS